MSNRRRSKHDRLHTIGDLFEWRCVYCGERVQCKTCSPDGSGLPATRDHVIPRAAGGGGKGVRNKVPACLACNQLKGSMSVDDFLKIKRPTRGLTYRIELVP